MSVKQDIQILGEVLVDGGRLLIDDGKRALKIAVGTADYTGAVCQIQGCHRDAVGVFELNKRYREPIDTCRLHWVGVHLLTKGVVALFWIAMGLILTTLLVMAL